LKLAFEWKVNLKIRLLRCPLARHVTNLTRLVSLSKRSHPTLSVFAAIFYTEFHAVSSA